ncbi:dUTP diphosphatase [Corynebacterium pseudopelargi]|uniref:dUTP diphosphatase n=1 Tax=Corynebacterium pseudopelargi TaxID=2080757 RepID=A0A3G6IXM4_9CORY|nr:dUTP diphosphatase [Corynebacterium pseudopelargi]AZA08724.1 Deoxyuridine 5'-triphosphate nucleotidohydrolase [Corynebacterium pseudopelargi]
MTPMPYITNRYPLRKAHADDAAYDLHNTGKITTIPPHHTTKIPTGIHAAIPQGHVGIIKDRSSIGAKGLAVRGGVIDPGYTGEIIVLIQNNSPRSQVIQPGDRVAQLLVIPTSPVTPVEVKVLQDTQRGDGGFGSTGA